MRQKIFGIKLLLLIAASFILTVAILMFFVDTPAKDEPTVFGAVKVKSNQGATSKKKLSNYQAIKQEQKGADSEANSFRYRVKIKKENPLLALYQEEQKPLVITKQPKRKKLLKKAPQEQSGFFSAQNTDVGSEKKFFKAIFKEKQQVQPGKPLRIVLQEAIPELSLAPGTVLKGIPKLVSERIDIWITAGIIEGEVRKLDLLCFDKEDCVRGLYHEQLAKQLEESPQADLLEEVLNLDFKGKGLARRAAGLTKHFQSIEIEKGRELLLAIPMKEE